MITIADTPEVLRRKIIHGLESMDFDELKRLHQLIAGIAAEKAILLADMDWKNNGLSRDKINEELKKYRQAKSNETGY